MKASHHRSVTALVFAAALVCQVSFTRAAGGEDPPPAAASALTVRLTTLERRDWRVAVPAYGWLAPWHEAVVASEAAGLKVTGILADVGSTVRAGEELARLSDVGVRADIAKQEAAVATARANLDQAAANAERGRRLGRTGALSEQEAAQYLITERVSQATLASEEAGLASQRIKLEQTRIVAPDDGIVSSRSAVLGAVVSSGTEMFRLIRQSRIEWQAEIGAREAERVREGQSAKVTGLDGTAIEGTVRLLAPTANRESGRILAFVALPVDARVKSGQFVNGTVEIGSRAALVLPQSALVPRDGRTYLFVLGAGGHVARVKVETGRRQEGMVEILSGLEADAQVVESGGAFLSDGALVKVVGETQARR